ncbi:hypothetical protein D9756_007473 [Leucocoprinus leucothites]|uniref:Uncharacterized protein n=1 Tax=Leucocoprinus leucothites TaxID=201217 RepID=A0A8H5D398_9AGAR|nr:hypothetical protein D9756_007473 [Leucoagaricus leucothites]
MEESTMVWLPKGYQIQSFLRIASISVALYDYLETAPTAYRFYREQWRSRRLTASCVLFMLLRLFSIIALTLSSVGFFYGGFNPKSCERFFLLPPIFKVLQIMVSQAILGFRVYNLAQRSEKVLYVGLFVYITTCSLQWVSTLVERDAVVDKHVHNCRAFSEQPKHLGAWVFYTIAMVYDILMTLTSVFYLLRYKLTSSSGSLMLKLVNMMLSDGLGYLIALTATNAINVTLYKTSTDIQSAAYVLGPTWLHYASSSDTPERHLATA